MWIFRIKSSLKQSINLGKKEFFKTIMIPLVLNAPEIEKWQKNIPEDKNMAN